MVGIGGNGNDARISVYDVLASTMIASARGCVRTVKDRLTVAVPAVTDIAAVLLFAMRSTRTFAGFALTTTDDESDETRYRFSTFAVPALTLIVAAFVDTANFLATLRTVAVFAVTVIVAAFAVTS